MLPGAGGPTTGRPNLGIISHGSDATETRVHRTLTWQEKSTRVGRPRKDEGEGCEEVDRLKAEAKQAEEELAVRQMRIDWLELKLKWSEEELREAKVRRQKQLKKKLKKK